MELGDREDPNRRNVLSEYLLLATGPGVDRGVASSTVVMARRETCASSTVLWRPLFSILAGTLEITIRSGRFPPALCRNAETTA